MPRRRAAAPPRRRRRAAPRAAPHPKPRPPGPAGPAPTSTIAPAPAALSLPSPRPPTRPASPRRPSAPSRRPAAGLPSPPVGSRWETAATVLQRRPGRDRLAGGGCVPGGASAAVRLRWRPGRRCRRRHQWPGLAGLSRSCRLRESGWDREGAGLWGGMDRFTDCGDAKMVTI
jgi:hypothetical protein